MRSLFVLLILFSSCVAEARGLGDRTRESLCEPGQLPPGAGISGCPQPLDSDSRGWRPDRTDGPLRAQPKPLWVPPVVPSLPSRP